MGEALYVVWSNEHGMFWRANRCGYTSIIDEAGRYSWAEAEAICQSACPRANSTIHEGTPPEIYMPAPEALGRVVSPSPDPALGRLRELSEKATQGEWRAGMSGPLPLPHVIDMGRPPGDMGRPPGSPFAVFHSDDGSSEANAAFALACVAYARAALSRAEGGVG